MFVPESVQSHTSRRAYHPGINYTNLLWTQFPTLETGALATSVPIAKHHTCLLQTLGSQGHTHIVLEFVTGLPLSRGNTIIMAIVDRFSKAAHFIALAHCL